MGCGVSCHDDDCECPGELRPWELAPCDRPEGCVCNEEDRDSLCPVHAEGETADLPAETMSQVVNGRLR